MLQRPFLYDDLTEVYSSFSLLSSGRQYNEAGPQPLSMVDVVAMMNELKIWSIDDRLEFQRYIRVLDHTLLEMIHAKIKQDRERLLSKTR